MDWLLSSLISSAATVVCSPACFRRDACVSPKPAIGSFSRHAKKTPAGVFGGNNMTSTNNDIEQRAPGQPYPTSLIRALSGATVAWWGTQPRGYWVWSAQCGREFIPLDGRGDRAKLKTWLGLRRAEERARSPSGVSA
jgi:hypothetical protein